MTNDTLSRQDLTALYQQLILDHARKPRHFGALAAATHEAQGINRLCGDKLTLYLEVDDDTISEAAFEGSGCAISVASASLLTDTVRGMTTDDAIAISRRLVDRLTRGTGAGTQTDQPFDKLAALDGVREFPSRVKCATLAWHALQSAINRDEAPASTE